MHRTIAALGLTLVSSFAVTGQTTEPQKQSWVAASHQLEKMPLDDAAVKSGETALHEVMDAKDFHVVLCQKFFNDFRQSNYKYRQAILRQYLLGSATEQVEHPDNAVSAQSVSGVESAVSAYQSILAQDPKAHDKMLNDLANKQKDGKLENYVRESCK